MRRLVATLLILVAACGARSPAQLIAAAPAAAAARGSARVSLTSAVRFSERGQSFESITRGEGVSELSGARRGHLVLTVTTTPSPAKALSPCEMASSGSVLYLKTRRGAAGKPWVGVDAAKIAGVDPSALSSDPTSQLDYLKTVDGNVKTLGRDVVRGVKTTRYRDVVKVDRFLDKLPAKTRDKMRSALGELGITSFPLTVWIDNDGLPRRLGFDWKSTKQGATIDIATQIDTYDYGTKVDVTVPDPKDVQPSTQPAAAFAECFGAPAGSIAGAPNA